MDVARIAPMRPTGGHMKMHARFLLASALALCAFAAQAQSTTAETAAAPQAEAQAKTTARDDAHCLRYTGSYIVSAENRRADMRHDDAKADAAAKPKHRCIYSAGRVYTREDIQNTGETDIGRALQMLDPSVTIGH
jgi:hypothetical protein